MGWIMWILMIAVVGWVICVVLAVKLAIGSRRGGEMLDKRREMDMGYMAKRRNQEREGIMGIKVNARMQFMGYKPNDGGELLEVKMREDDKDEDTLPGLTLSGFENGIWTGKKIDGKLELSKEEFHDLLNGEAMDGWAIFAVKIVDC